MIWNVLLELVSVFLLYAAYRAYRNHKLLDEMRHDFKYSGRDISTSPEPLVTLEEWGMSGLRARYQFQIVQARWRLQASLEALEDFARRHPSEAMDQAVQDLREIYYPQQWSPPEREIGPVVTADDVQFMLFTPDGSRQVSGDGYARGVDLNVSGEIDQLLRVYRRDEPPTADEEDPYRFGLDYDQREALSLTRAIDDANYLDLEKCWRCADPVPRDDDLGLCVECVQALKEA